MTPQEQARLIWHGPRSSDFYEPPAEFRSNFTPALIARCPLWVGQAAALVLAFVSTAGCK